MNAAAHVSPEVVHGYVWDHARTMYRIMLCALCDFTYQQQIQAAGLQWENLPDALREKLLRVMRDQLVMRAERIAEQQAQRKAAA